MKKLLFIALLFVAFSTSAMTVYFTHTTGHCTTVTVTGTSGDAFNGKTYRFNIPDGKLQLNGIDSTFTLTAGAISFYSWRGTLTFPKSAIDTANSSGNGTHITWGTAASMFSQINTLFFLDNSGAASLSDTTSTLATKAFVANTYYNKLQTNGLYPHYADSNAIANGYVTITKLNNAIGLISTIGADEGSVTVSALAGTVVIQARNGLDVHQSHGATTFHTGAGDIIINEDGSVTYPSLATDPGGPPTGSDLKQYNLNGIMTIMGNDGVPHAIELAP